MKVTRTFDDTQWVLVPVEPDMEWFKRIVFLAGVWPDENVPDALWRAVQKYHTAMLSASPDCPTAEQALVGMGFVVKVGELVASNGTTYPVNVFHPSRAADASWLDTDAYMTVFSTSNRGHAESEAQAWRDFFASVPKRERWLRKAAALRASPPLDSTLAESKP